MGIDQVWWSFEDQRMIWERWVVVGWMRRYEQHSCCQNWKQISEEIFVVVVVVLQETLKTEASFLAWTGISKMARDQIMGFVALVF